MDLAYLSVGETPAYIDGATSQKSPGTGTNNFAVPASATDGRLVLMHVMSNNEGDTIAPPSGWSTLIDDGATFNRQCLFGRICSGESGTWAFTKSGTGGSWRCSSAIVANAAMPTIVDLQRAASVTPVSHSMSAPAPNSMLVYFFGQETASPGINTNGNPTSSIATGLIQIVTQATNTGASPGCYVFSSLAGGGHVSGTESAAAWLRGVAFTMSGASPATTQQLAGLCVLIPPLV